MVSVLAVEIPYWGQSLLRVFAGIVAVLLPAGTIVYVFLFKMMSFMQSRLGPMEAGPYGSLQLFAEVGKWLQKEDLAPDAADQRIFKVAPLIVLVSTFLLVAALPFGPDAWLTNFQAGVFYALAVSSISVVGIIVAGWASANKYSLLGGLRAAGQLIAYELPMVLAAVGVFSLIAAVLFLGGWGVPFAWFGWESLDDVDDWMNLAGPLIMFTKMMLLSFIIMWVRFSFPRFREDQLQRFAWKVLIPLSLANIVVTAIVKVAV
jgi:NADH:ubiquinone oxidoreductase subunit H